MKIEGAPFNFHGSAQGIMKSMLPLHYTVRALRRVDAFPIRISLWNHPLRTGRSPSSHKLETLV